MADPSPPYRKTPKGLNPKSSSISRDENFPRIHGFYTQDRSGESSLDQYKGVDIFLPYDKLIRIDDMLQAEFVTYL